ncbi:hypothetical protein H5410_026123 [Solanum commersonii]|uniref:Uncharacterized protein n=1 Tax=Solanum commersonii TaxID=4109 RepID=A0A9J5YY24_SOLCO|nr:hypothetical protein H5410_026123 [Solanum commersonii]
MGSREGRMYARTHTLPMPCGVAGVRSQLIKVELWKEIEESLGLLNIGSLEESMSIIGFSCRNLPHQLKLYFGGLLKGKDIHVSKFSLEDAAEGLLEDLNSRNLVMDGEETQRKA